MTALLFALSELLAKVGYNAYRWQDGHVADRCHMIQGPVRQLCCWLRRRAYRAERRAELRWGGKRWLSADVDRCYGGPVSVYDDIPF